MYVANIVALSSYCIWKLYLAAKPWFHQYHRGVARPRSATFRIQDLPRQFSPGEVRAMTQDFRTMVGQGGFAQVFRGLLDDGTAVAVKRIASAGGGEDDFLSEISIVATVHHRSLVRLLGYCLQRGGGYRYLVYPFLESGSLDSWLFRGGEGRRRLLPWPARRRIAVDVARALAYLHHECHHQILHLDIKPGNILLDGDLRAHVSDFGISVSVTWGLSNVDTRGRGTPGYMAPEMMVNAVSARSDVFSYGMTLLELVGGRRNFEPSSSSTDASSATPDFARDFFPYIVREKMARGEVMEAVDAAMALVDRDEVEAVVKVALSCIQSRWDMRPSMLTVVDMLEGRVATDLPLPESWHLSTVNSSSLTHGR
ncbi:putative receptor-like protein kinase [Panicum miliaceum]|uniref:Receptor-like protein kinase n=1 Tax=Panicum miliaceum TaxID=4540 RepID=A0A3L6SS74_PANMI|nr:putative receptor-like protein kinase [Panicum miliaceum]